MPKFKLQNWWQNLSLAKKVRFCCLLVIFLILGLVFWFKIIPSGHITYNKDYGKFLQSGKGFIYNFTPQDRVDEEKGKYPRIIGDPVYFSVFTPRTFSQANVTVVYESNLSDDTPIIEAGVLADPIVWRYNLKPLKNKIIEKLAKNWFKITDQELTLWQKEPRYQSLDQFIGDLENNQLLACSADIKDCLAVYNYHPNINLPLNERLDFTESENAVLKIINPVALRGSHIVLLYLKDDGPLEVKVDLRAFNINKPINRAEVALFKGQELITKSNWPNLDLNKPQLKAGVYKLEIKIDNDVIIEKIESSALASVFANKIWPVATEDNITLFTDSPYLQIKAMSPASLQNISFNEEGFLLTEAYKQAELRLQEPVSINQIELEKDNIILENNGVFSFFKEQLFNPFLKKVDRFFLINPELEYILANYQEPQMDAGQQQASAEFSLIGAYREQGKYNFMLSIPGLRAEDNSGNYLVIKEIKIEMKGRSLWEKLFNLPDKYK